MEGIKKILNQYQIEIFGGILVLISIIIIVMSISLALNVG